MYAAHTVDRMWQKMKKKKEILDKFNAHIDTRPPNRYFRFKKLSLLGRVKFIGTNGRAKCMFKKKEQKNSSTGVLVLHTRLISIWLTVLVLKCSPHYVRLCDTLDVYNTSVLTRNEQ